MRRSISAQSCASVPPAPACIEQMALRASIGPDRSISVSASDTSCSRRATSSRNSPALASSSAANSKSTSASATADSKPSCRLTTRSMRLRCCKTFCAASWSDQKSGAEAFSSSRRNSARFDATSKKPPKLLDAHAQVFGTRAQVAVFVFIQLQSSRHSTSESRQISTACGSGRVLVAQCITRPLPQAVLTRSQSHSDTNSLLPSQRQRDGEQADEGARGSERVAEADVKSFAAVCARDRPCAHRFSEAPCLVRHFAARRDARAYPCVRHSQERASGLDRAEDGVREVLAHDCCVALVSVVRDFNQHVRAVVREAARDVRVRRFETDENSGARRRLRLTAERHQRVALARREVADDAAHRVRAGHPTRQRHVLAERHQANLIILRGHAALFIYEHRRVIPAPILRRFERVEEERRVLLSDEAHKLSAEITVALERKVHRRLRPYDDTRQLRDVHAANDVRATNVAACSV